MRNLKELHNEMLCTVPSNMIDGLYVCCAKGKDIEPSLCNVMRGSKIDPSAEYSDGEIQRHFESKSYSLIDVFTHTKGGYIPIKFGINDEVMFFDTLTDCQNYYNAVKSGADF